MSTLLGNDEPGVVAKATCVAAIKAILKNATYLQTADTGDKFIAATDLMTWIRAQLLSISSTDNVPAERQTFVARAATSCEIQPLVGPYARVVGRDNWKNNPKWPASELLTAEEKTAALIKARDKLFSTSVDLSVHYDTQLRELTESIASEYDTKITPGLPEVTSRTVESRAYLYTFVNDWGWESAPSPVSDLIDCDENDVVTISAPEPPAGYNINRMRLYRSSTTNAGAAFQFTVENDPVVSDWTNPLTRSYIDTTKQATLGEPCPTMNWDAPPDTLKGLTAMANGTLVGFIENQLLFCESYIPYAWPLQYRQTTETKIVGIGVVGQSAVVVTEGHPYYVSGVDAANMSAQKMEFNQSCVSKRTIASGDGGVLYASPDGVCLASSAGVQVITKGAISRRDWQTFMGATWTDVFAEYHEGVYYIINGSGVGYAIDLESRKISTFTQVCSGVFSDMLTDKLYAVSGTSLLDLFGSASNNTATWRSRVFVVGDQPAFSAIRVESNFESTVTVKVYGDGALVHTATFSGATARQQQRLPAGRYRDIEVQVEAACPVTRVTLATSPGELA